MEEQKSQEIQQNLIQNSQCYQGKRALILGGSGAVGRELIQYLCISKEWIKVSIIVRRKLNEWDNIQGKEKLDIIIKDNLDCLEKIDEWSQFQNYDSLYCCLGSRVQYGKNEFIKVDYTYCVLAAEIAIKYNIRHYLLLSSSGANEKSYFLYMKTKGRTENKLKSMQINKLSIFQPGMLRNRRNDRRCGEFIALYLCCCITIPTGISGKDMALSLLQVAEKPNNDKITIYSNSECKKIAKQAKKQYLIDQ
ncbi:hypothetical protein PPERSA_04071 [Pseudocohnilembus persalinus]|uniref:NAD(P)-binding domain-containing protein n=1 Tax=Pseudocohnilembus persalinus TaxID=266149 RepID=A0A0V0QKW7_PSEPJ|nr:hypothetical protein PPERSA_04071 [Pseudocohnilembus persalinus]|eukprot:KRX02868.1 hypothetical protein PPERSA_04071 [Pseudocohnilembus persalinus]